MSSCWNVILMKDHRWNVKLVKHHFDEASHWNVKFMKHHWWNVKFMKHQWLNVKLIKHLDETSCWWSITLMKRQIDEMSNWWIVKSIKRCDIISFDANLILQYSFQLLLTLTTEAALKSALSGELVTSSKNRCQWH